MNRPTILVCLVLRTSPADSYENRLALSAREKVEPRRRLYDAQASARRAGRLEERTPEYRCARL